MNEKRMSTLTQWSIQKHPDGWCNLMGLVWNDNRWPDRTMISTSMLESIDFKHMIAETSNTTYRLE